MYLLPFTISASGLIQEEMEEERMAEPKSMRRKQLSFLLPFWKAPTPPPPAPPREGQKSPPPSSPPPSGRSQRLPVDPVPSEEQREQPPVEDVGRITLAISSSDDKSNGKKSNSEPPSSSPQKTASPSKPHPPVEEKLTSPTGKKMSSTYSSASPTPGQERDRGSKTQISPATGVVGDDISRLVQTLGYGDDQDGGRGRVCVITLAGENKGASMVFSSDAAVPIRRRYDLEETENASQANVGEAETIGVHTNVNSNAQSINNSILQSSSCSGRSPGVYLVLDGRTNYSLDDLVHIGGRRRGEGEGKGTKEFGTVDKKPPVRRRCLRGLMAESSESDAGGGTKPPRHGCRFQM